MATPRKTKAPEGGPLKPGAVLQKRYTIERLIGGGGMGMVYLAHDRRLSNRPCAIKEMVDHFIDPQQRIEANEYFAREADTLAQLKHPAIPSITDRFDDRNRHYLVMEYVEGRNLEEELTARGGPLPEGMVIDIARQLLDVLAYLHSFTPPIIYRDMKPSNVMLTENGRVILIDFGIARLFQSSRKGTMIGTLGFAPPEQYKGQVDPRSDIYSLGATLHYVLTRRDPEKHPPFSFPPVRDLRPEVSANLAGAIDRALSYEADGRPASVAEFRDMMLYGRGLYRSGAAAVSPRSGTADLTFPTGMPLPAASREPRRPLNRALTFAVFCLVLGGAAFGATYVYSSPELQLKLGIKPLMDSLPWRHEEILARARQHPLEFQALTVALSTRDGTPLVGPKDSFTDVELRSTRYLRWKARFKNALAGLEGRTDKVEARIYDPNGLQIASSESARFVGPAQKVADFAAVALLPGGETKPIGRYKVALYSGGTKLAEQSFEVKEDVEARARAAAEKARAEARARAEAERRRKEVRRLAMIEARKREPLRLVKIEFLNSTKTGTALSPVSDSFNESTVLFVGWKAKFENRLYRLEPNQYRVDAAYVAPNGSTLGSVNDYQTVGANEKVVTFSGRIGNSHGHAFRPGTYTVNFYLNGRYLTARKFRVLASNAGPSRLGRGTRTRSSGLLSEIYSTGRIRGLEGGGSQPIELRLRPQPNGFLHGELQIHKKGFGVTPVEGFVRGNRVQFQVAYGAETYYFEGTKKGSALSGSFEATPSGAHGTWKTKAK